MLRPLDWLQAARTPKCRIIASVFALSNVVKATQCRQAGTSCDWKPFGTWEALLSCSS